MKPSELAQRSRTAAADNNAVVLTALASAGDGGRSPGELVALVGLPSRTVREALRRLADLGLIRRDGKRRVWATEAGRSEAGTGTPGLSLAPTLDVVLSCFPAEAQRAFMRLLLSAVLARRHLADAHADGWAGFIALGPSKTGKTSIAKLVCRLYDLDELQAIKLAGDETPGSLMTRREPDRDSPTGYRVRTSPLLELPFATIDEWDKADEPVRAAASRLLLGHAATELEGERVMMRPTVLVCLNVGREGLRVLHEAHVRRSVVLDTTPLRGLLADLDENMYRLFQELALPRLSLERLHLPSRTVAPELRRIFRDELRAGLTEQGWALADVEPLTRVALGRAALTDAPLEQALLATALDYLTCAATIGHAQPGFTARLAPQLGATRGALIPDPNAAEAEVEHRRVAARTAERKGVAARLAFEADRERKAATIIETRDGLGRIRDVERQAITSALTLAAKAIRGSRSPDALEAAWEAANPYLEQAHNWLTARTQAVQEQQRAQQRKRERQALERQQRAAATAARKAHECSRRALAKQQRSVAAQRRAAERQAAEQWRDALAELIPYESPAMLMAGLARLGVVRRISVPAAEHPDPQAGPFAKLTHRLMNPSHAYWQDRDGHRHADDHAPTIWSAYYNEADERVRALGGRGRPRQAKQGARPRPGAGRPAAKVPPRTSQRASSGRTSG